MTTAAAGNEGKTRFLVAYDYGMGALWWWVRARSPEEIVTTFAEVEVVGHPRSIERAEAWSLDEIDIDDTGPNPLSSHREKRQAQRDQPGFGALAGRERVFLRWTDGEQDEPVDDLVYLLELGPDGRRIRQVELHPDGSAVKSDDEDWPFNPPQDLYEPALASMEIGPEEFEDAWRRARRDTSA